MVPPELFEEKKREGKNPLELCCPGGLQCKEEHERNPGKEKVYPAAGKHFRTVSTMYSFCDIIEYIKRERALSRMKVSRKLLIEEQRSTECCLET